MNGSAVVLEDAKPSQVDVAPTHIGSDKIDACIGAVAPMDRWILERIQKSGYIADAATRFPSITPNTLESMNRRLKTAGIPKVLAFVGESNIHLLDTA